LIALLGFGRLAPSAAQESSPTTEETPTVEATIAATEVPTEMPTEAATEMPTELPTTAPAVASPAATVAAATPAAAAISPVGAWDLDTEADNPNNPRSVAIFNSDGTYAQADADGSNGYGSWQQTGTRTATLTIHFPNQNAQGNEAGTVIVRANVEMSSDGTSFTATYTLDFVDPTGTATGQYGPATATGQRIPVEGPGQTVGPISAFPGNQGTPTP
jgi:hypothetical protein